MVSDWLSVTNCVQSCERNFSYNLSWIFFKLCSCFCQGLKICIMFSCNPQIIFCHFFRSLNLVIFWLNFFQSWVPCECNSSYNFSQIFLKLCRFICQGLKMCMMFGCNPQMIFCYFFGSLNLVIFVRNIDAYRLWYFAHVFVKVWIFVTFLQFLSFP